MDNATKVSVDPTCCLVAQGAKASGGAYDVVTDVAVNYGISTTA